MEAMLLLAAHLCDRPKKAITPWGFEGVLATGRWVVSSVLLGVDSSVSHLTASVEPSHRVRG